MIEHWRTNHEAYADGAAEPLGRLFTRVVSGAGLGALSGLFMAWALDHDGLSDHHANAFVLATAIVTFSAANAVMHEAGILAVVVSGLVVAVRSPRRVAMVRQFKLELAGFDLGEIQNVVDDRQKGRA